MKKYLGIDWGEKRIGTALADSENNIATPFKTLQNISDIMKIIKEEKINFLIIGEPKSLRDGKVNNNRFVEFIKILKKKTEDLNLNIFFIDERFTSLEADSIMNKKLNSNRDNLSAMIILQNYLDKDKNDKN